MTDEKHILVDDEGLAAVLADVESAIATREKKAERRRKPGAAA